MNKLRAFFNRLDFAALNPKDMTWSTRAFLALLVFEAVANVTLTIWMLWP